MSPTGQNGQTQNSKENQKLKIELPTEQELQKAIAQSHLDALVKANKPKANKSENPTNVEKKNNPTSKEAEKTSQDLAGLKADTHLSEAEKNVTAKKPAQAPAEKADKEDKPKEEKGILDQAKDFGNYVKDAAIDNWQRIAGGVAARGIWKWFKSDDKKPEGSNTESTDKPNWFQRNRGRMLGGSVAAGASGYLFRDQLYKIPVIGGVLDNLFNPNKLSFEESMSAVKADLNNVDEANLKMGIKLERDETNSSINSFGESVKINKEEKKIEGLDIKFPTFKELINTANIINASKNTFRGKCVKKSPFYKTNMGGDIEVVISKDATEELISGAGIPVGKIAGGVLGSVTALAAGYYLGPKAGIYTGIGAIPGFIAAGDSLLDANDTLSKIAPTLNNNENKDRFIGYLNTMPDMTKGNQEVNPGQSENKKVNEIINKVKKDIESTNIEDDPNNTQGNERKISILNLEGHPNIYKLKAWNKEIYLKIESDKNGNITSTSIEDLGISFRCSGDGSDGLSQAIRTASFVNKSIKELWGKGDKRNAFEYHSYLGKSGLYFDKKGSAFDRRLSEESIKKNIPELLEKDNMEIFIKWLNNMKTDTGHTFWDALAGDSRKNTFLESLK